MRISEVIRKLFMWRPAPIVLGLVAMIVAWTAFAVLARDFRERIAFLGRIGALDPSTRLHGFWYYHLPGTSFLLGISVAGAYWLIRLVNAPRVSGSHSSVKRGLISTAETAVSADGVDKFFRIGVPLGTAFYFVYQLFAGSFFGTTTVSVKTIRCGKNLFMYVDLERGDNWLVDITADEYFAGYVDAKSFNTVKWRPIGFQRNKDDVLRLAPKERTGTVLAISPEPDGTSIVVAIDAYSILWPVPMESFAKTIVLPEVKSESSQSTCPIPGKEKENSK